MTRISMAGRLVSMRTMTDAMEKQKTDRKAISRPKAGMRSGSDRRPFATDCCLLSREVCEEVISTGTMICTFTSDGWLAARESSEA